MASRRSRPQIKCLSGVASAICGKARSDDSAKNAVKNAQKVPLQGATTVAAVAPVPVAPMPPVASSDDTSEDPRPERRVEPEPRVEPEIQGESFELPSAPQIVPQEPPSVTGPTQIIPPTTAPAPLERPLEKNGGCFEFERSAPFFSGHWLGTRDNWTGDVGISFMAEATCTITALGRHVDDSGQLASASLVTLWAEETKEPLVAVEVGPPSPVEGHYAFEAIPGAGVKIEAGKEYRLTQFCHLGMPDKWFDGFATPEEVGALCSSDCARLLGGVVRNGAGYPHKEDGQHRRAGMVNFRISLESGPGSACAKLDPRVEVAAVTREQLAQQLASCCSREVANRQALESYMSVVARVLALLVDEFANWRTSPAALVVIAPKEEILDNLRLKESGMNARHCDTVFSDNFATQACFKQPPSRMLDKYGGPMEAALLISHLSGEVLGANVQIFGRRYGARLLSAAGVAATLSCGIALTRSEQGHVTAFLPSEVQRGGVALRVGPGSGSSTAASSSASAGRQQSSGQGIPASPPEAFKGPGGAATSAAVPGMNLGGGSGNFKASMPMTRRVPPMSTMMALSPRQEQAVSSARGTTRSAESVSADSINANV